VGQPQADWRSAEPEGQIAPTLNAPKVCQKDQSERKKTGEVSKKTLREFGKATSLARKQIGNSNFRILLQAVLEIQVYILFW
jgi:hypothetical protein